MELIIALLGGLLIAIPLVAIIALVRTERLRKTTYEALEDHRDKIEFLSHEIASLRRDLARVSHPAEQPPVAAAPIPEAPVSEKIVAPPPAPVPEKSALPPVFVSQPPSQPQAVAPPPVTPIPPTPPAHTVPAPPVSVHPPLPAAPQQMPANPPIPSESRPAASAPAPVEPPQPAYARTTTPPSYASARAPSVPPLQFATAPPRKSFSEWLRSTLPLEEVLGMNLFAKIGIVLLVLGFALLGRVALISMGPGARVALIYAVSGVMLGGGISLENRERYRLVGRTGIGGGWALLFFTTYAMHHVAAMTVLSSNTLDCILMLLVAVAMVAHTLRYKSQLVTGLAFLLAFSTVALSQDSVYALVAGIILAMGIVAIALRMSWFELEVFGIVASYANHFYWLYKLFPDGVAGHPFPQFWSSAIILILYWAIFRVSYIVRRIRAPRDEAISTIAALVNTMSLLAVMKFQSIHPELAFYALLGLGAAEFIFGQLPITRRRRPAFALLTVIGTLMIFAAVPFKFSGNNIAFFWMIAAEALLVAGIVQSEVLFRRLGLLAGLVTGALIIYEAWHIVDFRQHSDAPLIQNGVLLLTCSLLFYLNSHFIGYRWRQLFAGIDGAFINLQSYLGGITAFLGIWCVLTRDWTAIGWAALMLAAACGTRYVQHKPLTAQASGLAVAVAVYALVVNFHLDTVYPHHVAARLITLPILALMFYLTSWAFAGTDDIRVLPRTLSLWLGTSYLVLLAALEIAPAWVAPVWMAMAILLSLAARRLNLRNLSFQEHLLAIGVVVQLIAANLDASKTLDRYLPLIACAAGLYAISRWCALKGASYRRPAAWMHTWAATAMLAALAWHESPEPWLAAIWAVFALALAIIDRVFDVEEFPYQAHALASLAVLRAITLNLFTQQKWHGIDLRLITVCILVASLYAIARWVRMPDSLRDSDVRHLYTWTGSGLFAWMLWSELLPIAVAVGIAIFGLMLFEIGSWKQQKQIRLQAYVALAAAFVRIFFVNLTASALPGETLSPRMYTVVPIALIFFYVWARLQSQKASPEIGSLSVSSLIAHFGTGCLAALIYYQTAAEWIVVAWACLVLVLMLATLLLDKEVFLQQAIALTAGIVIRGLAHNIFGGSYFVASGWRGNFAVLSLTSALLFSALPLAFKLRARYADRPMNSWLNRALAVRRPEQIFFFAPVLLITLMILVKMDPGMVTLSWGIEGLLVILLGLLVSQRSYRITGLLLLLLCVGKIVCLDAWRLNERDRYITLIVLGAALTLVSTLYGKYRETVRRLL